MAITQFSVKLTLQVCGLDGNGNRTIKLLNNYITLWKYSKCLNEMTLTI